MIESVGQNAVKRFEASIKKAYGDRAKSMTEQELQELDNINEDAQNAEDLRLVSDLRAFITTENERPEEEEEAVPTRGKTKSRAPRKKSAAYVNCFGIARTTHDLPEDREPDLSR